MRLVMTHKSKIIGLAVLSVLLPIVVIIALMFRFEDVVSHKATQELDQLATVNVGQIARDVYGICEISHDLIQQKIDHDLVVAREVLDKKGKLKTGSATVRWEATNQFTRETKTVVLPRFVAGKTWLLRNDKPEKATPIVDDVKRLAGGACTIFQRMNNRGDMLRVASSVVGSDGKRTIGAYIPAVNPDGAPNPIIENILQDQSYRCLASLQNSWYLTAYEPLYNQNKDVIGMLYVGEKLEAVASLRKTIANMQVGKSGEVGIIGTKGKYQGRYIISRGGARDGEDIWNTKDVSGGYFVQSAVRKALSQAPGKVVDEYYAIGNPGEGRPQKRIAAVLYFEPYDWLIWASAAESDYYSPAHRVDDSIRQLLFEIVVVGSGFLLLAVFVAVFLGKEMTRLLQFMTKLARNIAAGDLRQVRQDLANEFQKRGKKAQGRVITDETEELLVEFSLMTESLGSSAGRMRRSGEEIQYATREMVMAARKIETKAAGQHATLPQINTGLQELTATTDDLTKVLGDDQGHLNETIGETKSIRNDLVEMEKRLTHLKEVTTDLSAKFSLIDEQAGQFSLLAASMNRISDQTNLLSLNAAIEVEKAGEGGKGFSTVAREVRRMADQMAVTAREIDDMVKDLRQTVSSGCADNAQLGSDVESGLETAVRLTGQLGRIIDHLQAYEFRLDGMKSSLHGQPAGAKRIDEAINTLSAMSEETRESIKAFQAAAEHLHHVVVGLLAELSHDKTNASNPGGPLA